MLHVLYVNTGDVTLRHWVRDSWHFEGPRCPHHHRQAVHEGYLRQEHVAMILGEPEVGVEEV